VWSDQLPHSRPALAVLHQVEEVCTMDELILARVQFAANISFHILFPTITIALGWVLLFFKLRHGATGDERWMEAYRFWGRCSRSRSRWESSPE